MNYCGQPRLLCHAKSAAETAGTPWGCWITSGSNELVIKESGENLSFHFIRIGLGWIQRLCVQGVSTAPFAGLLWDHVLFKQWPLPACATDTATIYQSRFRGNANTFYSRLESDLSRSFHPCPGLLAFIGFLCNCPVFTLNPPRLLKRCFRQWLLSLKMTC